MAGWHGREAAAMAGWHGREAAAMGGLLEKKITDAFFLRHTHTHERASQIYKENPALSRTGTSPSCTSFARLWRCMLVVVSAREAGLADSSCRSARHHHWAHPTSCIQSSNVRAARKLAESKNASVTQGPRPREGKKLLRILIIQHYSFDTP
jgi:hypothetical protein